LLGKSSAAPTSNCKYPQVEYLQSEILLCEGNPEEKTRTHYLDHPKFFLFFQANNKQSKHYRPYSEQRHDGCESEAVRNRLTAEQSKNIK